MSAFPGAGAQVYYNDAGEPTGWDYPSDPSEYAYDDDWLDRGGPECDDDDVEEAEDAEAHPYRVTLVTKVSMVLDVQAVNDDDAREKAFQAFRCDWQGGATGEGGAWIEFDSVPSHVTNVEEL